MAESICTAVDQTQMLPAPPPCMNTTSMETSGLDCPMAPSLSVPESVLPCGKSPRRSSLSADEPASNGDVDATSRRVCIHYKVATGAIK